MCSESRILPPPFRDTLGCWLSWGVVACWLVSSRKDCTTGCWPNVPRTSLFLVVICLYIVTGLPQLSSSLSWKSPVPRGNNKYLQLMLFWSDSIFLLLVIAPCCVLCLLDDWLLRITMRRCLTPSSDGFQQSRDVSALKTMTPYCCRAHSEDDVFLTVLWNFDSLIFRSCYIVYPAWSLFCCLQVSWLLFSGLHHRSW